MPRARSPTLGPCPPPLLTSAPHPAGVKASSRGWPCTPGDEPHQPSAPRRGARPRVPDAHPPTFSRPTPAPRTRPLHPRPRSPNDQRSVARRGRCRTPRVRAGGTCPRQLDTLFPDAPPTDAPRRRRNVGGRAGSRLASYRSCGGNPVPRDRSDGTGPLVPGLQGIRTLRRTPTGPCHPGISNRSDHLHRYLARCRRIRSCGSTGRMVGLPSVRSMGHLGRADVLLPCCREHHPVRRWHSTSDAMGSLAFLTALSARTAAMWGAGRGSWAHGRSRRAGWRAAGGTWPDSFIPIRSCP